MNTLRQVIQKIGSSVQPISMLSLAQKLNLSRPISLKAMCNEADFYGNYTFRLDNFQITNTVSQSKDTDYVSFTLKVGDNQPQTRTKSMGDLGNGIYAVGLEFGPITISDPNTLVIFNYQILNKGYAKNNTEKEIFDALQSAGNALLKAGGTLLANSFGGGIWGFLIAGGVGFASLGLGELVSILTANCDGPVAVDQVAATGATLKNWLSRGSHTETRFYSKTHTPDGCHDSTYYVTWTVSKT
jgi:hypothetical protein